MNFDEKIKILGFFEGLRPLKFSVIEYPKIKFIIFLLTFPSLGRPYSHATTDEKCCAVIHSEMPYGFCGKQKFSGDQKSENIIEFR